MYNGLMVAKELSTGCEEKVNKVVAEGLSDPKRTSMSDATNVSAKLNRNPVGFKWVDEKGWVSLEAQSDALGGKF